MLYKNWCHSIDYNEVNKISGYILATKTLRTKRIVRMINHKTHIKRIDNTLYKRSYECKRRVRIISKVEKVLYSRAFFNVSSGAENILKTYFVFCALTKGFHKGRRQ